MCTQSQSIISLKSCDRIETGSGILRANDGSICTLLVEHLNPDGLPVELCSVCNRKSEADHQPSLIRQGCRLQLVLGESPDMIGEIDVSSFPSTRSMLESVFVGCSEGDVFCLDLFSEDDPGPPGTSSVVDNTNFTMTIRVLRVENPPRCMHNKSTPLDEDVEDPLSNPTSDWNPNLARFWYFRACFLKERGNWLIQKHSVDRQNKDASCGAQRSTYALDIWASAFKCYSRGLQLATLTRKAFETCPMLGSQEGHFIHRYHSLGLTEPAGDSEIVINLDVPEDLCLNIGEPCVQTIKRLEFSLLLNLALCQLKAGSAHSAAVNCTQALQMDPGWIRLVQSEIYPQFPVGSKPDSSSLHSCDIAKALYRRAQSYVVVSKWEEAISDLESAIRLQKLDTVKSGLALSEALLTHARQKMSEDTTKLAERLRNRRNLF